MGRWSKWWNRCKPTNELTTINKNVKPNTMKDQFLFWGGNDEGAESIEEMESYGQQEF